MKTKRSRANVLGFDRFSGLYLGAMFIVIFGFLTPKLFLTSNTVFSIASEQAIIAILGLALLMPLAAGVFDLSIGANINLAAIVVTLLQVNQGYSMWAAIGISLGLGLLIGLLNGFLVVVLKVSSFIATLGVGSIIAAVQIIVTGNRQPLPATGDAWTALTQTKILGFQMVFWYLLVLAVLIWWLLQRTPMGRYMYAIGGNEEAARLSGVPVGRYVWISFLVCGVTSALGGVLYASLSGPGLTFGGALLLPAYAAAFLGFTQIIPGRFNVWGTVIAVYVLAIGVRGLQYITSAQWLNSMFNGVAVIAAVAFAVWRQRAKILDDKADADDTENDGASSSDPAWKIAAQKPGGTEASGHADRESATPVVAAEAP